MAPKRSSLLVTALLAAGSSACVSYGPYGGGSPGHAYVIERRSYLVYTSTRLWNCDASTGTPQCWRVVTEP